MKIIAYLAHKIHDFKIPTNWLASEEERKKNYWKLNFGFHNFPCSKDNLDWLISNHMTPLKFKMYTIQYTILTIYQKLYPEHITFNECNQCPDFAHEKNVV